MTQNLINSIITVLRLNNHSMRWADFVKIFPDLTAMDIEHLNKRITRTNGVITPHGKKPRVFRLTAMEYGQIGLRYDPQGIPYND